MNTYHIQLKVNIPFINNSFHKHFASTFKIHLNPLITTHNMHIMHNIHNTTRKHILTNPHIPFMDINDPIHSQK